MLDSRGFDLWADDYDVSVGVSADDGTYPFAGYREVLNRIYNAVLDRGQKKVLDVGFGTGTLTAKLYQAGCEIWGQDFSERMMAIAGEKMPGARLYQGDFAQGLAAELKAQRYDAIIATYSLHHLDDGQKVRFIDELKGLLKEDGALYIGDVAFGTAAEMDACRQQAGDEWDDEEFYFVYDALKEALGDSEFTPCSHCAGVIEVRK